MCFTALCRPLEPTSCRSRHQILIKSEQRSRTIAAPSVIQQEGLPERNHHDKVTLRV
jgi:hypothetical protein